MYRPFIADPAHIALLDGQRYVVLRATGAVWDAYTRVQGQVKEKLTGFQVSYPAQPHVTLAGLARGTPLDAVPSKCDIRGVVAALAADHEARVSP